VFVSRGKATAEGAHTYYIDPEIGNDSWNGTHPLSPWKSFRNANRSTKKFKPGDRILLEANMVFNGTSVTNANKGTLLSSGAATVGMLILKGNGTQADPIVLDLYDRQGDPAQSQPVTVYYSANQRPIINGNGTPSLDSTKPYDGSGVIHLRGVHWWEVRNIEVTNSFDVPSFGTDAGLRDTHWYKTNAIKQLSGIKVWTENLDGAKPTTITDTSEWPDHVLIENCYVHDVQSTLPYGDTNSTLGNMSDSGFSIGNKISGGITLIGNNITVRGNIVRRVSLEALRFLGGNYANDNSTIEGNFLEYSGGDGIVTTSGEGESIVRNNIAKEMCSAPTSKNWNYASVWAMASKNTTFEYNEVYGTVYGWNDGEAWDVDQYCNNVVYQYNYSHHNAGGVCLFMSQDNSVFRYNVSANDGGGTKYMATVTTGVNTSANSYTSWNNGQCYFHFTNSMPSRSSGTPLIYNNTFFSGDGLTCGVFGNNDNANNRYVRFYNNIIVKAGEGTIHLAYGQSGNGNGSGSISNPTGFKNNILWAYNTDPVVEAPDKIKNGNVNVKDTNLYSTSGLNNKWQNPGLKIQEAASITELRAQRDTLFPDSDINNPAALATFTGTARLRERAKFFKAVDLSKIAGGMEIPSGGGTAVDGAWDAPRLTEDLFGATINHSAPNIGAAQGVY
jgi:hypothetical protein